MSHFSTKQYFEAMQMERGNVLFSLGEGDFLFFFSF